MMHARQTAFLILRKYEQSKVYLNLELKDSLEELSPQDKALATELVYGVVRYRLNLDYVCSQFTKKHLQDSVRCILRLGIYQILYLDKIPDSAACNESVKLAHRYAGKAAVGFVNAILRNVAASKDNITYPADNLHHLMYKYSFPEQLVCMWLKDYKWFVTQDMVKAFNQNRPVFVRPNLLKATYDEVKEKLAAEDLLLQRESDGFYIKSFSQTLPLFTEGLCTVQGQASMRAVRLLSPKAGETVLDLCASPGGKSCYMAELMENSGKIVSCDLHLHRLALIEKTAQRLGASNLQICLNDAKVFRSDFYEKFDKILADVPCSGLGVIGSKPDIKWKEFNFDILADLQYNMLKTAISYLKTGGELVYSTCTVNKQENEEVVGRVLADCPDVALVSEMIQLFPQDGTDGFFMCKLKKGVKSHGKSEAERSDV